MALIGVLSACTHTHPLVLQPTPNPAAPESLNRNLENREVTLALRDGPRLEARDVQVTSSGLSWHRAGTVETQVTKMTDVRELSFRSRLRGALDGLLIGFAIGAPAGALVIDAPHGGSGQRVQAALAGGLSIGAWSTIFGAIKGSRIVYRVEPPAPMSNQQSPPWESQNQR